MKQRIWLVLCLILLASCSSVPGVQVTETAIPTTTSTLTPTITLTPSTTPSPFPTRTPTATLPPINTLEPTWTALPTLQNSFRAIETLLVSNGNCRLPCWWGITPGETSWNEAQQYLDSLVNGIDRIPRPRMSKVPGSHEFRVYFSTPVTHDAGHTIINVRDGFVQIIGLEQGTTLRAFQYDVLLSEYGAPDRIILRRGDFFLLGLLYQEERFLAEFSINLDQTVDPVQICLTLFGPFITSWADSESYIEDRSEFQNDTYPPFEVLTGFDEQAFYERFRVRQADPCFTLLN